MFYLFGVYHSCHHHLLVETLHTADKGNMYLTTVLKMGGQGPPGFYNSRLSPSASGDFWPRLFGKQIPGATSKISVTKTNQTTKFQIPKLLKKGPISGKSLEFTFKIGGVIVLQILWSFNCETTTFQVIKNL